MVIATWLVMALLQEAPPPASPPAAPAATAPSSKKDDASQTKDAPAAKKQDAPAKKDDAKAQKDAAGAKKDAGMPAVAAARAGVALPTPRPKPPEVPSYRVSIRMKNGRRFVGVVSRDKAFSDTVRSGAHHSDAVYATPASFMLRYVDGLDGEIGLSWQQIQKLDVREILDSAGMRAMDSNFVTARDVRREQAETPAAETTGDAPADPAAPATGSDGEKPAEGDAAPTDEAPDAKPEVPLLTEFAPEQGWNPERRKQIEWRRTVVGVFPDEREARFLDVYERWEPLFLDWTREQQQKAREAETTKGDRGTVRAGLRPVAKPPAKTEKGEPKPADKPADKPAEKPGDKPATKPAEKSGDKPAEKPAGKPADASPAKGDGTAGGR
jgi:hypothetical protein